MAERTLDGSGKGPHGAPPADFPWTLEVALSGGGLRAAAYALGALLYLVHSGLNVRVKNICSVSGGSITNAFVACYRDSEKKTDFANFELSEFQKAVRLLAEKIAFSGLLQAWQPWAWGISVAIVVVLFLLSAAAVTGSWTVVNLMLVVLVIVGGVAAVVYFPPYRRLLQRFPPSVWGMVLTIVALIAPILVSLLAAILVIAGLVGIGVLLNPSLAVYSQHAPKVALGLFAALVALLWLRSWPIARWMATIVPPDEELGDLSDRRVGHVFCATDLNFGLPFFFSTADGGQIFSTLHGLSDGRSVRVIKAVRASSAFPPAIPPISLNLDTRCLREYSGDGEGPGRLWLTDGGAFNNFATEWHRLRRRLFRLFEKTDPKGLDEVAWYHARYGQVQLVIDASELSRGTGLTLLRVPVIGFFAYVFRTMHVMYGSTLAGRSSDAEYAALYRMTRHPNKWLTPKRGWSDVTKPRFDPTFDREMDELGALPLYVAHSKPVKYIADQWPSDMLYQGFPRKKWDERNDHAASKFREYWPWNDTRLLKPKWQEVPTTFRRLGRDVTLKLIIEGYLKTREVLFCAFGYEGQEILDRDTFSSLIPERHGPFKRFLARFGRSRMDAAPSAQRAP